MTPAKRKKLCGQLARLIRNEKTFFLSGHRKPDGDTVASELAMASLLKRLKKKVEIYNYESVPESLAFLPGASQIRTAKKVETKYDVAMIFECNDADRMGNIIDLDAQAQTVVNIDHHLKHTNFGDINFINVQASSNSEQLYYLYEALKMPITQAEATCLYVGIMTDTGRFMHSNTNSETLRIASKLVERGVDVSFLTEKIFGTRSLGGLKLLGYCLNGLKMIAGQKISYMVLRKEDFARLGATHEDTEEVVNYGLQPPTALISILFKESDNGVKISLRARRNVNVCSLAQQFGGGGHKYASGCTLSGAIDEVVPKVLRLSEKLLQSPTLELPVSA